MYIVDFTKMFHSRLCVLAVLMVMIHVGYCGEVLSSSFVESNDISQAYGSETVEDPMKLKLTTEKPNIVLIVADDMGWGDVGANWPETVDTPNLDLMAKQGLRMTDFHAGASVCAPSRAALLTGRLGLRNGVIRNFGNDAVGGIPVNETTLGEVLLEAGYRTAMLGKWHLGTMPGHHPLDKGFQSYLGVPYSIDMGCADPAGSNLPQCSNCPHENSVYSQDTDHPYSYCFEDLALPLYRDKNIIHQPVQLSNLSSRYADFTADFIRNSSADGSPYFLYAAFSHIHVPLAHAQFFDNFTGRGIFADTLRELDWLVGKIVIDAMKQNSNTLVWFISDNGPWSVKCDLAGSGGPFTGDWQRDLQLGGGGSSAKATVWEAGHRVPSIIYWPPQVQPGQISSALVSAFDIMPTLAAVAKAILPSDRYFDGMNVLPLITGDTQQGHKVLFHPNSGAAGPDGEVGAVRVGQNKVVFYSGGLPDCSGRVGPIQQHFQQPLVFSLDVDSAERSPLDPSSSEYNAIVLKAREALSTLTANIKVDNISIADYSMRSSSRPCCNANSSICRCPWD